MVCREVVGGPTVGYQGDGSSQEFVAKLMPPAGMRTAEEESTSEGSSSIGVPSESSGEGKEGEGEEVESEYRGGLVSLEALEESLPIK